MYTVKEVSEQSGVSVRTLHYYDEIGLLKPCTLSEGGYRLYDEESLAVLQQILFLKELDFPLAQIKEMLSSPNYDKNHAFIRQKELLLLKVARYERLIAFIDGQIKGGNTMSFQAFDREEIEKSKQKYAQEVQERWGTTDAYKESEKKTKQYNDADWERLSNESSAIYAQFIAAMPKGYRSVEAQDAVKAWQAYISENFYTCTIEILSGLGEMYRADERFVKNIDQQKEGLSFFMADAIAHYCK